MIGDRNVFFLNSKFSDLWRNVCVGGAEKRKSEKENPERFDFAEAHSGLTLIRLVMTQNWSFFLKPPKNTNKQINIIKMIENGF